MALSNLQVFNKWTRLAAMETLDQQVRLFNAATNGAILLTAGKAVGDYIDTLSLAFMSGLTRTRDPYSANTTALTVKSLSAMLETAVRVAAGSYPIQLNFSDQEWIGYTDEEIGAIVGQAMAGQMLQQQLNLAIGALSAALQNVASVTTDVTAETNPYPSPINLNSTASKFGDRSADIAVWVMHSVAMHRLFENALQNTENLFRWDTVNVMRDAFGRLYVMTDSPNLVVSGTPDNYITLGLQRGAAVVQQNDDFVDNYDTVNGYENIKRTYQAEWSFNLSLRGYTWDKTNGGHAPNTAALTTGTNWDKVATSIKDTAGVVMVSQ